MSHIWRVALIRGLTVGNNCYDCTFGITTVPTYMVRKVDIYNTTVKGERARV